MATLTERKHKERVFKDPFKSKSNRRYSYKPIPTGDNNTVLCGERVSGESLDVPVPHCRWLRQEKRKTEPWCARNL